MAKAIKDFNKWWMESMEETELWSCPCCTYSNPDAFDKCYLCRADKQGEGGLSFIEAAEQLGKGIKI